MPFFHCDWQESCDGGGGRSRLGRNGADSGAMRRPALVSRTAAPAAGIGSSGGGGGGSGSGGGGATARGGSKQTSSGMMGQSLTRMENEFLASYLHRYAVSKSNTSLYPFRNIQAQDGYYGTGAFRIPDSEYEAFLVTMGRLWKPHISRLFLSEVLPADPSVPMKAFFDLDFLVHADAIPVAATNPPTNMTIDASAHHYQRSSDAYPRRANSNPLRGYDDVVGGVGDDDDDLQPLLLAPEERVQRHIVTLLQQLLQVIGPVLAGFYPAHDPHASLFDVAVTMSPVRPTVRDGILLHKVGVHLIFVNLLVTGPQLRMMFDAVMRLVDQLPVHTELNAWDRIFDAGLADCARYRSLRMVYMSKCEQCDASPCARATCIRCGGAGRIVSPDSEHRLAYMYDARIQELVAPDEYWSALDTDAFFRGSGGASGMGGGGGGGGGGFGSSSTGSNNNMHVVFLVCSLRTRTLASMRAASTQAYGRLQAVGHLPTEPTPGFVIPAELDVTQHPDHPTIASGGVTTTTTTSSISSMNVAGPLSPHKALTQRSMLAGAEADATRDVRPLLLVTRRLADTEAWAPITAHAHASGAGAAGPRMVEISLHDRRVAIIRRWLQSLDWRWRSLRVQRLLRHASGYYYRVIVRGAPDGSSVSATRAHHFCCIKGDYHHNACIYFHIYPNMLVQHCYSQVCSGKKSKGLGPAVSVAAAPLTLGGGHHGVEAAADATLIATGSASVLTMASSLPGGGGDGVGGPVRRGASLIRYPMPDDISDQLFPPLAPNEPMSKQITPSAPTGHATAEAWGEDMPESAAKRPRQDDPSSGGRIPRLRSLLQETPLQRLLGVHSGGTGVNETSPSSSLTHSKDARGASSQRRRPLCTCSLPCSTVYFAERKMLSFVCPAKSAAGHRQCSFVQDIGHREADQILVRPAALGATSVSMLGSTGSCSPAQTSPLASALSLGKSSWDDDSVKAESACGSTPFVPAMSISPASSSSPTCS